MARNFQYDFTFTFFAFAKFLCQFWLNEIFASSRVLAMFHSLQWWFKPVNALPLPKGPLCTTIIPATIPVVNEEVGTSSMPSRGEIC